MERKNEEWASKQKTEQNLSNKQSKGFLKLKQEFGREKKKADSNPSPVNKYLGKQETIGFKASNNNQVTHHPLQHNSGEPMIKKKAYGRQSISRPMRIVALIKANNRSLRSALAGGPKLDCSPAYSSSSR